MLQMSWLYSGQSSLKFEGFSGVQSVSRGCFFMKALEVHLSSE